MLIQAKNPVFMSLKISSVRRNFSLTALFLLFFQVGFSQLTPYPEIDRALKMNQQELGKDAIMMIYKSGKIVYEYGLVLISIRLAGCTCA